MKLTDIPIESTSIVTDLSALPTTIRKKLMVMGLLPKSKIKVVRIAPLGDPLQVTVQGVNIAIRKKIADLITVESIS